MSQILQINIFLEFERHCEHNRIQKWYLILSKHTRRVRYQEYEEHKCEEEKCVSDQKAPTHFLQTFLQHKLNSSKCWRHSDGLIFFLKDELAVTTNQQQWWTLSHLFLNEQKMIMCRLWEHNEDQCQEIQFIYIWKSALLCQISY